MTIPHNQQIIPSWQKCMLNVSIRRQLSALCAYFSAVLVRLCGEMMHNSRVHSHHKRGLLFSPSCGYFGVVLLAPTSFEQCGFPSLTSSFSSSLSLRSHLPVPPPSSSSSPSCDV